MEQLGKISYSYLLVKHAQGRGDEQDETVAMII